MLRKTKAVKTTKTRIVMKQIRTIFVKFNALSSVYAYLSYNDKIKVGDRVIVDSPSSGYTIVQVVNVKEGAESKATKFIVQRIDDEEYRQAESRHHEREQIKADLRAIQKNRSEIDQFHELARSDTQAKALLNRLEELGD